MIKEIALKYDDKELFKFACEFEKDGATNPMQMAVQKGIADKAPIQGLHYDRLTSLAARAKSDPSQLGKMHEAANALKKGGVSRLDDVAKKGMLSAIKKPTIKAEIIPFAKKLLPIAKKA